MEIRNNNGPKLNPRGTPKGGIIAVVYSELYSILNKISFK